MKFKHTPIMLNECIKGLKIKKGGIYVDCTLGGGGHSYEILKNLDGGLLIGIDKDMDAINASRMRLSKYSNKTKFINLDFKEYEKVLNDLDINYVDGILIDLGISSYQVDSPDRGFSYMSDARLDMRMDRQQNFSAYNIVNEYSESELIRILYNYGEEKYAKIIAKNIVEIRKMSEIERTGQLVDIIRKSYPANIRNKKSHPAKKTFQAIRIEVNKELSGLDNSIKSMIKSLNKGGRIVVISFHSLEDRIIKNVFKEESSECVCDAEAPICVCSKKASIKIINKKPIIPGSTEISLNTRSKSAKLRIAEKI